MTILGTVALIFMILPVLLVLYMSVIGTSYISIPASSYSLRWFIEVFDRRQLIEGLRFSFFVAACAAALAVAVSLPAALALSRADFRGKSVIENIVLLPAVIPSVVTGVALYISLYAMGSVVGERLVPSTPALVAAHLLITLPWAFRMTYAGLLSMGPEVERAAVDLGDTRSGALRRVTLPMIRSSLLGAGILAFILSFSNLEISLFLVESGRSTLPVALAQYAQFKVDPTIAAASTIQIAIVCIVLAIANRFIDFGTTFGGGTKK